MDDTTTTATPGPHDTGWFTDTDELDKMLDDRRATDKLCKSSFDDAKAVVDAFAQDTQAGAWSASLRRADVAQRLAAMVTPPASDSGQPASGPRILNQGGLNLCGPAAFFEMALGRDPVAVMRFASDLFDNGTASIGNLVVTSHPNLLAADFDAMLAASPNHPFSAAEWMLFSALRNSMDVFWQPSWTGDPTQELAGLTRPEELAGWMAKSGIWTKVDDHGKWASNPGIPNAMNLSMADGMDIALLIHTNLIAKSNLRNPDNPNAPRDASNPANPNPYRSDDAFLLSSFPDHWVVLLNEVGMDEKHENVSLAIWSWATRLYLEAPKQVFLDNYYGAVIAQV